MLYFWTMYTFNSLILIGLYILKATHADEYNLALNKAVSTSTNVPDHPATMATDKDLNTYVQVNPVNNPGTWIQFDLKGVYNITKIIIWPTNDEADYFLARVFSFVRLTNTTAYDFNDIFCTYLSPVKGVSYNCSKNNNAVKGRYVLLKKESSYTTELLKIAEVAILTEDTEFLVPITGQVEQNHALNNLTMYDATKAIDRSVYTCIFTAQETEVYRNIVGWWRADLSYVYQVTAVNINDFYASVGQQQYQGFYSVYVDSGDFTKQQLCSVFNQKSSFFLQLESFFQLKCNSVLTARYLTVEKISSAFRPDALIFCEVQVVAIHKDSEYTLPINYIGVSLTSITSATTTITTTTTTTISTTTTTTTTKTQIPFSPTSPLSTSSTTKTQIPFSPTSSLTTSSTTKTPSTSTTAISISAVKIQIRQDKVFQNHDFKDSPSAAKFAVDNILETCSFTAQEDINNRNKVGWWRADLEDTYDVVYVIITDRLVSQPVSGYINIFIDRDNNNTQSQLCLSYDRATSIMDKFTNLTCNSKVTGRFLTISKIPGRERMDALGLCEVQVFGYISSTTTISTTTTTMVSWENVIKNLQQQNQNLETEKIVIGVVVCIITAILFSILGFVCGNIYQKKKSVKPTEATIYERTKVENVDQHIYSDLNNTPMKEINTYYNENK